VSSATAASCAANGEDVGNIYTVRFTPPNLGNNGSKWRLSFFSLSYGQNYEFYSGNYPTNTAKNVDLAASIGRGAQNFTVTPQVAVTKLTPSTYSINNTFVYIEGKIRNIGNNATVSLSDGCDVSFRMVGELKP
jgi:hypothetical protein